ncbi:PREDICTED: isoleucine--tRNA ligase, mitochondrial [Dufourea novaeangliae]|uniref:isoleucine--tRNA ligase, mitochondrial n=1 Tax=Dufourea novaeangliae TaxID=178035 RepID=UPI0007675A0F|nr:PREDICTED: isoleucine--tRNA ligase, mitochondrial [Dufourea novaeangliae]
MQRLLFGQKRTLFGEVKIQINGNSIHGTRTKTTAKKRHKYSDTVLLPRTQFPAQINGKKRIEKDKYLTTKAGFSELYEWQRTHLSGPEFILHDGPPYANGVPHMGHAINKILKDITLRSNVVQGNRVHYIPGWDCHGLPIEMKAIQDVNMNDPLMIRQQAQEYAKKAIARQKQAFQSWGVMANWNESGCYFTNESSYIKNQLCQFIKLYEKGIIFQNFMPVYWSPSSRTALAESELDYNEQHQSKSAIVRLRIDKFPEKLNSLKNRIAYALTWTTTPWTLVANQAVCFAMDAMYCLAEDSEGNLNIVGEELLQNVEAKIGPLKPIIRVKGKELEGTTYFHPFTEKRLPFLPARHVTMNLGTGLVHTAPAHGREDFLVALENNMSVVSFVDVEGRYIEAAGPEFHGLKVLTEGTDKVLHHMAKDVLHVEMFTHSYPYDWRTKQPVLIRASNQWFININSVRDNVIDSIADIKIYPECNRNSFTNALLAGIKDRPYWCISRQRSWGVPIPVLFNKVTGKSLTSRALIERLCHAIDEYGPDCWWKYSKDELIGLNVIQEMNVPIDDVEKGKDIMDIWFDSGISWSAVLPEGKANLCLEGYDQFNGWFQSSLITSIALQNCPPYRGLFVHGFAVDENGLKMSKSVGNVIDPEEILLGGSNLEKSPVYGVDVLRWWVASHGTQHMKIPVSKVLLDGCKQSIHKLRLILRFLLGCLYPHHQGVHCEPHYRIIDKYMLYALYHYNEQMLEHYNNYEYHHASKTIMNFVANDVSALYCFLIKDRVYCDEATSPSRIAALSVLRETLTVLLRTIAPIVPHLAEEVWSYHPENHASIPFHHTSYRVPESWNDPKIVERLNAAFCIRNKLLNTVSTNTWELSGTIEATTADFVWLSLLHDEKQRSTSELCEILQLSSIKLIENPDVTETQIQVESNQKVLCDRCRRYPEVGEDGLCLRCAGIVAKDKSASAVM